AVFTPIAQSVPPPVRSAGIAENSVPILPADATDDDVFGRWPNRPIELSGSVAGAALVTLLALQIAFNLISCFLLPVPGEDFGPVFLPDLCPCLPLLIFATTAILFGRWMWCSYANLGQLGVAGLNYSPAEAGFSPFIPIVNMFYPWLILQEMWQASTP